MFSGCGLMSCILCKGLEFLEHAVMIMETVIEIRSW